MIPYSLMLSIVELRPCRQDSHSQLLMYIPRNLHNGLSRNDMYAFFADREVAVGVEVDRVLQ